MAQTKKLTPKEIVGKLDRLILFINAEKKKIARDVASGRIVEYRFSLGTDENTGELYLQESIIVPVDTLDDDGR
ncbi:MAG: hypothetical protein J6Y86_11380 [Pseudobutyrivibrio sp.]|nr:hypothetical protein [Pseudobutyrivibrio sp.]